MDKPITAIGKTSFRNEMRIFGIKQEDRRRHFYTLGKTGMGKTTLLENMAISDIQAGRGVAIVDPHGDFAERILDYVPSSRINDVVYFNPADINYPVSFNVMENVPVERRHLVSSGLVSVFKKIWADSWGPRLEYLLRNTILSLLEIPGSTLLGIMRMLVDKDYRNRIITKINDPIIKSFWIEEFSRYHQQFQVEAIAPIQNKVGQFITTPLVRNIIGQTVSSIDVRKVMDESMILVVNLSKGRVGEDNSALLGALVITKLQLAAMERINVPESERKDFYLYVDEFQNFATESFVNILSEARKYRLNLILSHQYINQLIEPVRDAVFGNVGTLVIFRVGPEDAEFLEKEFYPTFNQYDLVNLPRYHVYVKLMIDGVASEPFSAVTLPPPSPPRVSYRDKIIEVSRRRFASSRKEIEDKIARWSGIVVNTQTPAKDQKIPKEEKRAVQSGSKAGSEGEKAETHQFYFTRCSACGSPIKVKFRPDQDKAVFCQDCLRKAKELKRQGRISKLSEYVAFRAIQEGHADLVAAENVSGKEDKGYISLRDFIQKKKQTSEKDSKRKNKSELKDLQQGEIIDL